MHGFCSWLDLCFNKRSGDIAFTTAGDQCLGQYYQGFVMIWDYTCMTDSSGLHR